MNKNIKFLIISSLVIILASCNKEENNNLESNNWDNIKVYKVIEQTLSIDERCIWCNKCVMISPENFEMNRDTFKAVVISQKNKFSEQVQYAIDVCPVDSIHLW